MSTKTKESLTVNAITHKNQWLQYTAGILATLPMLMGGNVVGWASPTIEKLENRLTSGQTSWIASIHSIGSIFFSPFVGIFSHYFGRKYVLLLSAPFFLLSWILLYVAKDVPMIYIGKFIAGFGIAISSMACSMYIGEITEKNIRGRILALIQFMNNLGTLVGLSVGPYVTYHHFVLILSIFPIAFFITFIFMPKSPYFLLQKNDRENAMQNLLKLRALKDPKLLNDELNLMQQAVEYEMSNKGSYYELISNASARKSLIVILGIKSMMHFSGITAIQSYMQPIFDETNSPMSSAMAGIVCSLIQLAAGFFSYLFIDHCGRKPLLISSLIGCFVTLMGVGSYFLTTEYYGKDGSSISWLPIASIMVFMAVQPIGVGNLAYVLLGELFPANLKDQAGVVATMYGSAVSFSVVKLFGYIGAAQKMYISFFVCALFMLLGIVFTIFVVPETKRKSLHEIQEEINADEILDHHQPTEQS